MSFRKVYTLTHTLAYTYRLSTHKCIASIYMCDFIVRISRKERLARVCDLNKLLPLLRI